MKKTFNIAQIAKEDKWVVEYNSDSDALYWSRPKISTTAILKKFLDDFSLYINESGRVEGLFIEYAKYNFISHNKEYSALLDHLVKVDEDKFVIPKKNLSEAQPLLNNMANLVANETLEAVLNGADLRHLVAA